MSPKRTRASKLVNYSRLHANPRHTICSPQCIGQSVRIMPPPPPQEVAKDSSQKRHYQKPIVYECAFGIENEPECQRSRIASRTLSGKTVRCSSNRFVQVHSPLTPSLISGNFSRNLGVLCSIKDWTLLSTLKGKRN